MHTLLHAHNVRLFAAGVARIWLSPRYHFTPVHGSNSPINQLRLLCSALRFFAFEPPLLALLRSSCCLRSCTCSAVPLSGTTSSCMNCFPHNPQAMSCICSEPRCQPGCHAVVPFQTCQSVHTLSFASDSYIPALILHLITHASHGDETGCEDWKTAACRSQRKPLQCCMVAATRVPFKNRVYLGDGSTAECMTARRKPREREAQAREVGDRAYVRRRCI